MLSELLHAFSVDSPIAYLRHDSKLLGLAVAVLALLSWRIYRFTILPALYPNDPKEYPYWIPVLGHLTSFFKNSSELLTRARLYFNDTREPFAVTVAGGRLYVLTHPDDVAAAYRNTGTLSFDIFVQEVMRSSGVSDAGIVKTFQDADPGKQCHPNPLHKPLIRLTKELHIQQLYPGNLLDEVTQAYVSYFERDLDVTKIGERERYAETTPASAVTVSLFLWASDVFTSAGQEAYFGHLLGEIEPDMVWTFVEFESLAWQVLYQYPAFLSGKMLAARNKMLAALEKYFERPLSEREDTVWFTPALEREMRLLDIDTPDMANMFMQTYWGLNANTRKAAFWILAYMLFSPGLIDAIRAETAPAFSETGSVDVNYLSESCPRLNGIWEETIRLTAFSSSVRYLAQDTEIGEKVLRKGNRIMMPYRQLHFNEQVFGPDVAEFVPDRFVKEPGLKRHPSLRPFGGGVTLCPGRFAAKSAVITFVAMVVQRFDIELAPASQPFPRAEEGNPVLGLMDVKEGCDLKVNLTPREREKKA